MTFTWGDTVRVTPEARDWIFLQLGEAMVKPPLKDEVETLVQLMRQDLEPDPGGGGVKIREGVVPPDRRVSVEDREMRHGRKSKSKRFNGYKRHIATDLYPTSSSPAPSRRRTGPGTRRHDTAKGPRDEIPFKLFGVLELSSGRPLAEAVHRRHEPTRTEGVALRHRRRDHRRRDLRPPRAQRRGRSSVEYLSG